MGLYRIPLKPGATERIPATMISLGFPIVRVELRENVSYYFYRDPKRQREFAFWTSYGDQKFWYCGISSSANRIAKGFSEAGLFEDESAG